MDTAYIGESFESFYEVSDTRDPTRTPTEAYYSVYVGGELVNGGKMVISGKEISFRFEPTRAGVHDIIIQYRIGSDTWKKPFQINVVDIG